MFVCAKCVSCSYPNHVLQINQKRCWLILMLFVCEIIFNQNSLCVSQKRFLYHDVVRVQNHCFCFHWIKFFISVHWNQSLETFFDQTCENNSLQIQCPSSKNYFSAFLNNCVLSYDVIMIDNELCPLGFSHTCFRRPIILFFLSWIITAAVGSI